MSLPAVASSLTERWAWLVSEAAVLSCSCPGLAHTARARLCSSWDARCHFQPVLAQHQRLPGELMDAQLLLLPRWFTSGEGFCFPCRKKPYRSVGRSASWHLSWVRGCQLPGTPDEEAWSGSRTRSRSSALQAWLGEQLRPESAAAPKGFRKEIWGLQRGVTQVQNVILLGKRERKSNHRCGMHKQECCLPDKGNNSPRYW